MSGVVVNIVFVSLLGLVGLVMVIRARTRSAGDVIEDLGLEREEDEESEGPKRRVIDLGTRGGSRLVLGDELSAMGLFEAEARKKFALSQRVIPVASAISLLLLRTMFLSASVRGTIITGALGFCLGYLYTQRRARNLKDRYKRQIEYFLPIVMERIVMAVEAGLDILAALGALLELDEELEQKKSDDPEEKQPEPLTRLLSIVYKLTESGLSFDRALHEVAESVDCSALRHAFIHLALAHKEGGELVMPLRELSDSTQLYFQETVEEEIAKMPVKATMPLLCTFTGLIIFFITTPVIEVLSITSKAMPK